MTVEQLVWAVCCGLCVLVITILGWGLSRFIKQLDEMVTRFEALFTAVHEGDSKLWAKLGTLDTRLVKLETIYSSQSECQR